MLEVEPIRTLYLLTYYLLTCLLSLSLSLSLSLLLPTITIAKWYPSFK